MFEPSHDVTLPTVSNAATEIDSDSASDIDEHHGFATGQEFGSSGVEGDFTNGRELGGLGVEGDFTIEDDFMNGSCMPGLTILKRSHWLVLWLRHRSSGPSLTS